VYHKNAVTLTGAAKVDRLDFKPWREGGGKEGRRQGHKDKSRGEAEEWRKKEGERVRVGKKRKRMLAGPGPLAVPVAHPPPVLPEESTFKSPTR
jgi:hypothetical protein